MPQPDLVKEQFDHYWIAHTGICHESVKDTADQVAIAVYEAALWGYRQGVAHAQVNR